jgi:predicted O-methyltransferase YrrM
MTAQHAGEVIDADCYRLRDLAKVWTPRTMFDIGTAAGTASLLARSLWPDVQVVGFEEDHEATRAARLNLPWARIEQASVGYDLSGREMVRRFGWPDLLKVDCEGGEVPLFFDLARHGLLESFRVIVGEWHFWPGRRLLEEALAELFDTRFFDPPPGRGPWERFFAVRKGVLPDVRAALLDH